MITKKVKVDCELGREVLIFDYRQAGLTPPAVLDGKLFGVIRIHPLKPLQFDESESKLIH